MTLGTKQRCDCHHDKVMGIAFPGTGLLVTDRRHGTLHGKVFTLVELWRVLDPEGTTLQRVGTIA